MREFYATFWPFLGFGRVFRLRARGRKRDVQRNATSGTGNRDGGALHGRKACRGARPTRSLRGDAFETEAAIETGNAVYQELRRALPPSRTLARTPIQGSPRVRGSSPTIANAIAQLFEQSPTFGELVAAINRTDGIVYVHHGQCGRNVLACLLLAVTRAGPNRILHIKVDPRRKGRDLMVSIGHELQHAVELLSEPAVVDGNTAHNFYQRSVSIDRYNFETQAAIEIELKIDKELREWVKRR